MDMKKNPNWEEEKIETEFGQRIKVGRHKAKNLATKNANELLLDAGANIMSDKSIVGEGAVAVGALAIHIYMYPTIGECLFISQINTHENVQKMIYEKAISQLAKDLTDKYGGKIVTQRSGF